MQTPKSEETSAVPRLPFTFAKRQGVVLTTNENQAPIIALRRDASPSALAEANRLIQGKARIEVVENAKFEQLLNQAYQNDSEETMQMVEGIGDDPDLALLADYVPETEDLLEQEDDAPIIRLINAILTEAVKTNASDVHIETYEKQLVVRFRIDGVLREVVQPRRVLAPLLVSRIKVMARLDIAEKRVPQDGRIALRVAGREIDLRVSTIPAAQGERVVLRILDKQSGHIDLMSLGMSKNDLREMRALVDEPHGILLVTGPTGSGKSTTLYACLQAINDRSRNIMTVEDPIEYNLPGIGQIQVNSKVDMTFARGLRAILRQDPDVVMIGEIRDLETAEIAVQASLTGHLVMSTLHTNTAVGAITRLMDMGIEPFLISSSLVGIVAQRLVRVLCRSCRTPVEATPTHCSYLGVDPDAPPTIYQANGCPACNQLGYSGRIGIYEVVPVDDALGVLIHQSAGERALEAEARSKFPSIQTDGAQKVLQGITTIEEVMRVTNRKQ